jgi:hypothetical protein
MGSIIVSALLGAVVTLAIQGAISGLMYVRESRNGEFTGTWYAVLPASSGKAERREVMRVRQRRQVLAVSIRRYSPPEESGRRWRMTAYVHGNILIGLFYTRVPKRDPSSYGAILLHRDDSVKDCMVWRGYYVRPDGNTLAEIVDLRAERHPIVWQQLRPEQRLYDLHSGPDAGRLADSGETRRPAGGGREP